MVQLLGQQNGSENILTQCRGHTGVHTKRLSIFFMAVIVIVLSGCVPLPPKDAPLQLAQLDTTDFVPPGNALISWPSAQWWEQFNDAQLNRLVTQGVIKSPTIALAQARVQQALAMVSVVGANQGAYVTLDGQVSHQLYSSNFIYPPPLGGSIATSANLDLNLRYEFDFWGRQRSAIAAALGERAAAQAESVAAKNALAAAIIKTYFQWQMLSARVDLLQQIEKQRHTLLGFEEQQVRAGLIAPESMQGSKGEMSAARQAVVQLETQREQALYQLRTLVNNKDGSFNLTAQKLPPAIAGLPSNLTLDLLARRPDVNAMRDRVQVSLSRIDEARAAFYPNLNLSVFLGLSSLHITNLLQSSSREYGVTPALHLPIFDANRLRAGLNTRRAELAIAIAQYEQTVQTAISEVNDAAIRLQGLGLEQGPLEAQEQAAQSEMGIAGVRLQAGLSNQREVIDRQINLLNLKNQQIIRHAQALFAQIDLLKALGGGFRSEK